MKNFLKIMLIMLMSIGAVGLCFGFLNNTDKGSNKNPSSEVVKNENLTKKLLINGSVIGVDNDGSGQEGYTAKTDEFLTSGDFDLAACVNDQINDGNVTGTSGMLLMISFNEIKIDKELYFTIFGDGIATVTFDYKDGSQFKMESGDKILLHMGKTLIGLIVETNPSCVDSFFRISN